MTESTKLTNKEMLTFIASKIIRVELAVEYAINVVKKLETRLEVSNQKLDVILEYDPDPDENISIPFNDLGALKEEKERIQTILSDLEDIESMIENNKDGEVTPGISGTS